MDRVGQQLGNYRLIRSLGSGGFADVYLGEHIYLKTLAAIKILQTRLAQNDLQVFLAEARKPVRDGCQPLSPSRRPARRWGGVRGVNPHPTPNTR